MIHLTYPFKALMDVTFHKISKKNMNRNVWYKYEEKHAS